jgi:NOL1/NOP2/fmu family ribosome biogenesis protein
LAGPDERQRIFGYMEHRFGIVRACFDPFLLVKRKRSWSLIRSHRRIHQAGILKVDRVGIKAFRQVGDYLKPTTRMMQIFGNEATRGRVELDRWELARIREGKELVLNLAVEPGYVILGWKRESVLGMGLYVQGTLRSQIPVKELQRVHIP